MRNGTEVNWFTLDLATIFRGLRRSAGRQCEVVHIGIRVTVSDSGPSQHGSGEGACQLRKTYTAASSASSAASLRAIRQSRFGSGPTRATSLAGPPFQWA